jgi:hypothetical protein
MACSRVNIIIIIIIIINLNRLNLEGHDHAVYRGKPYCPNICGG